MSAASRIAEFVIDKASGEPLSRRIQIYRDMASLVVDDASVKELSALADVLEDIERRHGQLVLDFRRRGAR